MGARAVVAVAFAALLTGACTSTQPIQVVADSYCIASKKITWVPEDTSETIDQIVKHNSGVDKACGVKGKKAAPVS